ncbi:hypothetical protein E4T56_gene16978 [Termitomyces sp. T112]|nr:hypothetical protein E4T56_gene16978 [Termitomyces sp. T112]
MADEAGSIGCEGGIAEDVVGMAVGVDDIADRLAGAGAHRGEQGLAPAPAAAVWASTLEDGRVVATRLFAEIDEGYPDGPCVDAEGCVWVSLFAGWGVRRYDPSGALMQTIRFPVANITKIAFGGPDLRTAYAATAAKGLSSEAHTQQPLAGALFAFDPGVAGIPGVLAQV